MYRLAGESRINQEDVPGVELCFPGNLLVLRDGRVGYIDFGIVGRVQPSMWAAVEALLGAAAARDYVTMARALCTLGVTATDVDIPVRAPAAPPTDVVAGGRQTLMMISISGENFVCGRRGRAVPDIGSV